MKTNYAQVGLFPTAKAGSTSRIVLSVTGMGIVPSFKTGKIATAWIDSHRVRAMTYNGELWLAKKSIRLMCRPLTKPEHATWKEQVVQLFVSQLRSAFPTIGDAIQTAALPRSLIATSMPYDDCWTQFMDISVKSEKCEPGQEGATIIIERIK